MGNGGLRYQYARLNIAQKLIAVNVLVYLANELLPFLFKLGADFFEQWFWLPKVFGEFFAQPWSIFTYSFFHAGFFHLLFNMIVLNFASRILLNLFGAKKFLNVYFLGVMAGGAAFILSYNIFPVFLENSLPMIGASAGVMAVLIFVCTYIPNQSIRIFSFSIKLWHIGVFFVLLDLVQIPIGNSGGRIAHLGGALLGYSYARQLTKGNDIGAGFSKFLDGIANLFKKSEKKASMKTVYRKENSKSKSKLTKSDYGKEANQRKIDAILDKISKSGYESLSKSEKDFLFKVGKEE